MSPFDLFLGTLAIGAGVGACFFFVLAAFVVAQRLAALLDSTIAALKRYAVRDMVVRAYYDAETMQHVREWQSPTWNHVQIFKRNAKKGAGR
jgi:hypothetical protein